MTPQEAVGLLNQAADEMVAWQAPAATHEERTQIRAEIRMQLWQAEKAFYDAGFAAAANLATIAYTPTQPR